MPLSTFKDHPRLWLTLLIAAVQGVVLFRLHVAIEGERWPATDLRWLASLYVVTIFVPVTIHLLAAHLRARVLWLAVGVLAAIGIGVGWQFGANVGKPAQGIVDGEAAWLFSLALILLWLLCMPFLRCRLEQGRWRCGYVELFSAAWQNKLTLLEAAAFTGVFWLLLALWAALFKTLGYEVFEDLFTDPAFAYPFTAITFGLSMHLVGSVERLVSVAREQILGLLKWLAPVAGLILLLFVPTLLLKLPDLVFEGERAIGAAWLLWLLAVTVTLLNAGYQNGQTEKPYPRVLGMALRIVVPLMPIVALVAIYALTIRMREYGITVARVNGLIVAGAALVYAFGYAVAALRAGHWMRGIERVNVAVALGLIATIFLTLTPVLSPYRMAAASQSMRVLQAQNNERQSAMRYLRFDAGEYGRRRVEEFSRLQGGESEQSLAKLAQGTLELAHRHAPQVLQAADVLSTLPVYPAGRTLDPALVQAVGEFNDYGDEPGQEQSHPGVVLFADLTGDGVEESVVMSRYSIQVFERNGTGWRHSAEGDAPLDLNALRRRHEDLEAGRFAVVAPTLNDLRIGEEVIAMKPVFR